MPTYEYRCDKCSKSFLQVMSFAQHGRKKKPPCPKCDSGAKVRQVPSVFMAQTSKKS